jgi:tRNA threonylcarbamoyladenosine biosynthesis protein TsaE
MEFLVTDTSGLSPVVKALESLADEVNIVAFYGEMGAGKTTLIKQLCAKLGVVDVVSSPTFSLVNEYITIAGDPIYHFDFYRIKRLEEAFDIGYEHYFFSSFLCLIEWPEKIEQLLPESYVKVTIIVDSETDFRHIKVETISSNET